MNKDSARTNDNYSNINKSSRTRNSVDDYDKKIENVEYDPNNKFTASNSFTQIKAKIINRDNDNKKIESAYDSRANFPFKTTKYQGVSYVKNKIPDNQIIRRKSKWY
jgi:hypothetical protein